MSNMNINGKCVNSIKTGIEIMVNSEIYIFSPCDIGVCQGENLLHLLFFDIFK